MTEADARDLLRRHDGQGGVENWIAGRRWKATPGGWTVSGELQGWHFRLVVVPGGLQIEAGEPGAAPTVWIVTPRP